MNHCETCKHWFIPAWDTGGFGTCCLRLHCKDADEEPPFRLNVSGPDGPDKPFAYLGTHKDFGCIAHQEKA